MVKLDGFDLIKSINKTTGFRVELFYYVDNVKEGYKARFYGDSSEDYQMKEVFDDPIEAVFRLIEEYRISI